MQLDKFQGDKNPRGRPKGRGVAWYLKQIGEEPLPDGKTKNQRVAEFMFEMALEDDMKPQDRARVISDIMDRQDGKPQQTNLNAEVSINPFDDIDTAKLEELRKKLTDNNTP